MENKDLARIFSEIADLLEIKEDNPFRIRAFRRTAQILENLSFHATRAVQEDAERLRAISGIGEGTIRKIQEIVETGECREHVELRSQFPPSLLTLLELHSLGPKKISLFWKNLNISTVDELEAAARAQKLRVLPGIGEKTEQIILKAIQDYRRSQGRFRLDDGMEVSQSLIDYLKSKARVKRISAAGSLRRMRETIGDVDILVSCESPPEAIDVFVKHQDVRQVLAQGDTKASVLLSRGLQTDLRVLEDESFGAALQYFTGSKTHNVALRERARKMGYKINEYGLFRLSDDQKVAGREEEEIYRLLGLPLIPPELREDGGEIEAAEAGRLPSLVELQDIRGDLHMHTKASDGQDSIEVMAAAGVQAGYEYIAITDHSKALAMTGGLDEEKLLEHLEAIRQVESRNPGIHILKGIEVDVLGDGALDLSNEALSQLDVVIAAVHSRFNLTQQEMTLRICRALENPYVNILAHPTGRILKRREAYPLDIEQVMGTARDRRVCLEINAYPARLDLNDVYCRMARDMGALLSINSDSHNREMLHYMRYGVFTARRGWLEAGDVINTYPLARLKRVLRKEEYR